MSADGKKAPDGAKAGDGKAAAAGGASGTDKKSVSIAPGTANNEKEKTSAADKKAAAVGGAGTAAAGSAAGADTGDGDDEFSTTNCRMYESKYPEADDLVIVQVKNVAEMGAYVSLLEYGGIEGMILLSELSRRRIRSINKLIRVGRTEVVVVLRVDKEKGYIDLSKRRVSPEDIVRCEEKYNKSKAVHSIMRHVAETCKVQLEDLYVQFGWDLYKKYGHAYDSFKLAVSQPEKVLGPYKIRDDIQKALLANIRRRLTPQPIKIRADLEVTCFSPDGIDAIKAALHAGEGVSTPDMPIKIKLVAPPLYVMMTTSLNKEKGIQLLTDSCAAIDKTIKAKGGDLTIKTEPRAVSERDDRLLHLLMETLEKQNTEVAGDDETEDAPAANS